MIVIFFTRRFYPSIGGVEKHVLEISKILKKDKFEIKIITENLDNRLKPYEELSGIKIYRIPSFKENKAKKFKIWFWLFRHINLISNADIVHAHDVFYWYLPFKFMFLNKKVFTTFHGYETNFPPKKNAIFLRRISKFLSTKSINIGEYIYKWYKTPAEFILFGGVDKKNLEKKNSYDFNWNKKINIVFVGRIEKDNGIKIYCDILKQFKNKKIKFNFIAVGDGALSNEFKQYGKVMGFKENVFIFLKNADIVFASSYLSMMEAFSFKKIVVSVWENNLKKDYLNLTPFNNFIISGNSGLEVTNKLINLKNNERVKMIDNAFKFSKENTWEDIIKMYKKLWNL